MDAETVAGSPGPEPHLSSAYIARQPILDRAQALVAYELFFRKDAQAQTAAGRDGLDTDATVLVNVLSNFGSEWLLGDKLAFVNVSADLLDSGYLELVNPGRLVLEVEDAGPGTRAGTDAIAAWRRKGFRIALGLWALAGAKRELLPHADYLKIDLACVGVERLPIVLKLVAAFPRVRLVAEKVETREQFEACRELGFHHFQGYYFARPQTLVSRVLDPQHAMVVRLLRAVAKDADVAEVEEILKRDPALSFKLLRYINSAGFGLSCEITSFRHAVMVLGYRNLYRWLTLLLVTANKSGTSPALLQTAIVRGRLVELLAAAHLQGEERDNAFVAGVFSLLDVMLQMKMDDVVATLSLPESLADAIQRRQGLYGPFLQLAEACERGEQALAEELAGLLQLDRARVNQAHLSALAWAENLVGEASAA